MCAKHTYFYHRVNTHAIVYCIGAKHKLCLYCIVCNGLPGQQQLVCCYVLLLARLHGLPNGQKQLWGSKVGHLLDPSRVKLHALWITLFHVH